MGSGKEAEVKQSKMIKGWLETEGNPNVKKEEDSGEKNKENILVLVGTYTIGKERLVKGAYEFFEMKNVIVVKQN
jgi:hypothetical protein